MKNLREIIALTILIIFLGCKQDFPNKIENDNIPPQPVTNVSVKNYSGKVTIYYLPPDDDDFLYVEAEVQLISEGKPVRVQSSYFVNDLTIEGFGESKEYEVRLYAIDRSGNKSESVIVTVHPLIPPIQTVRESIVVNADFGGIQVDFKNPDAENVVISVATQEINGLWEIADSYYTKEEIGNFSVRGYESESRIFMVFVRDRWGNYSDTLSVEITPLFEQELDKSKFREFSPSLPGDALPFRTAVLPRIWDGKSTDFRTDNGSGIPHRFSFDLGIKAKLSRVVLWQRGLNNESERNLIYANGAPEKFEIWGSNNPNLDGSYDGWEKLADCNSIKPSNLPLGQISNEDFEYALAGENFNIPIEAPAVRYIRFKMLKMWSGADFSNIAELTFFGDDR